MVTQDHAWPTGAAATASSEELSLDHLQLDVLLALLEEIINKSSLAAG